MINTGFNLELKGVDFALTALIISIFVDQWRGCKKHLPAILGVTITIVCLCVFGRENFLLPALLILVAALLAGRRWIDEH